MPALSPDVSQNRPFACAARAGFDLYRQMTLFSVRFIDAREDGLFGGVRAAFRFKLARACKNAGRA
ncbi:MAG: hypothetical protein IPO30_16355 [Hyphomonadaceae bacterium]|nr:hypothetical protein [Hyphomonadaceae bacterium]